MSYNVASRSTIFTLFLLCFFTFNIKTDQVWIAGGGAGSTNDVLNEDLYLAAALITLDHSDVLIQALASDVTVTMGQDTTIEGLPAGNSSLQLEASAGRTITFIMDHSLTFQGSTGGVPSDLLIKVIGGGQVIFEFEGGNTLTLTRNGIAGTVQMYVRQDTSTLLFIRSATDADPISNVEVVVEEGAILSYVGETAQPNAPLAETGTITWNVTNALGTGRMILTIGDTGAVIVRGRLVATSADDFTLADIDPATPAGFEALFQTINSNSTFSGSLLVQNYNNTLGEFIWDPWGNLLVRDLPPFGNFSGVQYGFIVGSYGELAIGPDSYLDYVGLTNTLCPNPPIEDAAARVKPRSASALFTDGQPDPDFVAPLISLQEQSGLYFRSGVSNYGEIRTLSDPNPFTVDPTQKTPGAGIPVFDIEGPLSITGVNGSNVGDQLSGFELLSLEVDPTGGSLFVGDGLTIFPLRTFATVPGQDPCTGQDETVYLTYNNACFLNNGRVDLCSVSWIHTDQNHHVFENNDVSSEPAYIGGETWTIILCIAKPKWAFVKSRFNIQMSVALTGVDLLVPNNTVCEPIEDGNTSWFVFYENGYAIDSGNGRQMILGTFIGSTACDGCCSVINKDAQLDIMQTTTAVGDPISTVQELILSTTQNDNTIVEAIPAGVGLTDQYSIQTIYLGNNSNISIGTNGDVGTSMEVTVTMQYNFALVTLPELLIDGNFFSFETRGGENSMPSTSNVTGQGGIFVDMNGTISIGSQVCGYRTNMGAMVTRSRNGVIDLPKNRVFFDPRVGIATWNIDLNDPSQWVVISDDMSLSDYNLNWMFTEKDYNIFTPYAVNCYDVCSCPPVVTANVTGIPTIEGSVQQLQIQGSRIGDPAHIKVSGGIVGELVMLVGFNSAEAPVAVVVLEDNAQVGLGTAHRNVDSLCASVQLGVNGINLILNGDQATVILNEDVIINNTCSILPGPNIGADGVLTIRSDCCNTLRVTKDGILDLSAFVTGQTVEFAGDLKVVFEPGSTVIYGSDLGVGPTLRFAENATCEFEPVADLTGLFNGTDLVGTDTVRVKFGGIGILEFADCSRADLSRNAFVGIEALVPCGILETDIRLRLADSAEFYVGNTDCRGAGGALQIGNTQDIEDTSITFSLILDGSQAKFEIGPQGFFGAGVGIVNKPATGHDSWIVGPTANVQNITLDLRNGIFRHAQLYAGDDERSALMALSNSANGNVLNEAFNFYSDPLPGSGSARYSGPLLSNTTLLGGGNFIAIDSTLTNTLNPVVGTQNGFVTSGDSAIYAAGILSSTSIVRGPIFVNADAFTAQLLGRVQNVLDLNPTTNRCVAAPSDLRNQIRVGYVDTAGVVGTEGSIGRVEIRNVVGKTPQTTVQQHTLDIGAVKVSLPPISDGFPAPRPIVRVIEIGN